MGLFGEIEQHDLLHLRLFGPGDVAIVQTSSSQKDFAGLNGKQVTLVKFLGATYGQDAVDYWEVDDECFVREVCLRKPYDGHDKCSWESCIWEPDLVGVDERV